MKVQLSNVVVLDQSSSSFEPDVV